jgi:hypothetical protein
LLDPEAVLAVYGALQVVLEVIFMRATARSSSYIAATAVLCLIFPSVAVRAQRLGSVLELIAVEGDLTVGTEVTSALSSSDIRAPDDSYMEAWTIDGRPGESVTIDLIADDFDPFIYVSGPGFEQTLSDDDSGGACYARLTLTFLETGTFRVVASSNGQRETGPYVLRVSETPGPTAGYPCGGMNPAVLLDLPIDGRTVALGDEVYGSLTASSPAIGPDSKKAEAWHLDGQAGESVTVTLVSEDFDCYLYIVGPGLGEVLSDDDGAGDLDSQLTLSFPEDGTYVVVASTLSGGSTGAYSLRVEEPTDMRDLPTAGRILSVGEEARGSLTSSDPVVESGRRGQAWALEGQQGTTLTIELTSKEFDCFLYLIGPGLSDPITDDDGAGNLDSRITFTFPMDGTYLVIVSALSTGEGPYAIRVEESVGMNDLPTDDRVVEIGGTMSGWLSDSDPIVDDGRIGQVWALAGRRGETYTIDLMSDDFDSYLYVVGPGLIEPRTNDDGGDGLDSRLTLTLPEDGTYRIVTSAHSMSSLGDYSLRVVSSGR